MGLFGSKAAVHTNAPRHWPAVSVRKWDESNLWNNITEIAKPLVEGLRSMPPPQLSARKLLLFDDGILEIPLFIEESGQRFAVFAFAVVNDETAGQYSAARTLLRQRGGMQAIYYASEPLRPAKPVQVLQSLDSPHFSPLKEERPDAEYATWWATAEDPTFAESPARGFLERWFKAFDGYGSYAFSAFAHDLELVSEETALVGLPAQAHLEGMKGPGELDMYLLASIDTGLALAFDIARTSARDRNALLKLAAEFAEGLRSALDEQDLPAVPEEGGKAFAFWRRTVQEALALEAAGSALQIGHVLEAGSARASFVGASDLGGRKAAMGSRPSEGLTAFAQGEMDAALVRVRAMVAEYGSEGPHLHPFVSMQREGQVRRVAILMGEEPDVVAAASQILHEHQGARYASVAYDGFLTLSGDRTECLYILSHEENTESAFLKGQRYVIRDGKVASTGSEMLVDQGGPLFRADRRAGEPRSIHDLLARQALTDLQRWLAIGPPDSVDGDSELFSCVLHYDANPGPRMERLMMMSRLAAEDRAVESLASEGAASAKWATITSDEPATDGAAAARSFRFRVGERRDPFSTVYQQRYVALSGKPVTLLGGLDRVAYADPLF